MVAMNRSIFFTEAMKTRFYSIIFFAGLLSASSCVVLNDVGLVYYREKGDHVSTRLIEAAILNDLSYNFIAENNPKFSALSLFSDKILNIDKNAWYKTSDVDQCIHEMQMLTNIFTSSAISLYYCALEPDHKILDDPFPEL
jgi:small lipoprotein (TIGR04452 family)